MPPSPDLAPPLGLALRALRSPLDAVAAPLALAAARAAWRSDAGRLDLILPDGRRLRLGGDGAADAVAHVRDERALARLLLRGELGAGEAYVAGEWDADDLVAVIRLFLRATRARGLESPLTRLGRLPVRVRHWRAGNSRTGSARNIHAHYDLGNDFYRLFLDDSMAYSCALWPRPDITLDEAQAAKAERLCGWLDLGAGDHLLEIGGGWGGLAIHAARTRGCRVTAITISRQQLAEAQARVAAAGVADRVDIAFCDYRDLTGTFDKVVSVEMLEAVGLRYLPGYFATVASVLRPGGRAVIQSITMPDDRFEAYRRGVDWMQTYVFPGSLIPSLGAIRGALAGSGLAITDLDDIGPDYAPTLRVWRQRFEAQLAAVRALGHSEAFIRTWRLYLAFSEAAFAERTLGDHQIVLERAR